MVRAFATESASVCTVPVGAGTVAQTTVVNADHFSWDGTTLAFSLVADDTPPPPSAAVSAPRWLKAFAKRSSPHWPRRRSAARDVDRRDPTPLTVPLGDRHAARSGGRRLLS